MNNLGYSKTLIIFSLTGLLTSCTLSQALRVSQRIIKRSVATPEETLEETQTQAPSTPIPASLLARYQPIEDVEIWFDELYRHTNFAKLEQFIDQSLSQEHQDEKVSAYLTRLYLALTEMPSHDYHYELEDEQYFQQQKAVLDEWIATRPNAHIPWLLRGMLLTHYGWEIREAKWGRDVPTEVRAQFKQYLQAAQNDMERAAELNPDDPNVWSQLILIARGLSLPRNVWEHYYQQGLAANPHHLGVRGHQLISLSPKWFGSREDMLVFAQANYTAAQQADKPLLGAVTLGAFREIDRQEQGYLSQPRVWTQMQEIYKGIFAKYPDDIRMRYYYAYDAYIAQQYEEALRQFEMIGDRWTTGTPWNKLEKFHRFRAQSYSQVAHMTYAQGDYERAETLALKAVELLPTARTYLLLGGISGNVHRDLLKTAEYARQALAANPTETERQYAEEFIRKAEQLQAQ
ncbi:MAG: DUF4034 domain-containing protein [Cyanothece sp. SIO1E1]|nr:DUF4034 domain-containing protein [Cyanothece sp. SIO1E1]